MVQGLEFMIYGLWFMVWGLGFGTRVRGYGAVPVYVKGDATRKMASIEATHSSIATFFFTSSTFVHTHCNRYQRKTFLRLSHWARIDGSGLRVQHPCT